MRTAPRRHLSYASLVLLLAADVLALAAFLLNQWLAVGQGWAWLIAATLTMATMPALLWAADKVFEAARNVGNTVISGGTIP